MPKIYQRSKDKRWTTQPYVDSRGKKHYIYGQTQREVREKLKQLIAQDVAGDIPTGADTTLRAWLRFWLDDVIAPNHPATTLSGYRLAANRVIAVIGDVHLRALTPAHCQRVYSSMAGKYQASTIVNTKTVLTSALETAVDWSYIPRNPNRRTTTPRVPKRRPNVLTDEEATHFLQSSRDSSYYALWLTLLETGLRISEALGLTWPNTDIPGKLLHIDRQLDLTKTELVPLKSDSSIRDIRITRGLAAALEKLRHNPPPTIQTSLPLVFLSKNGNPLDRGTVWSTLRNELRAAGLPPLSAHELRHTCASILVARGVKVSRVQELLGHRDSSTTMDRYVHSLPGDEDHARRTMEELFG